MKQIIFHAALFTILLSLAMLPFIISLCKAASRPMPSPPANGGTPPKKGDNLDAPTLTRRDIREMRKHGFEVVHPAPFDGLKPLEPSKDNVAELTHIFKP